MFESLFAKCKEQIQCIKMGFFDTQKDADKCTRWQKADGITLVRILQAFLALKSSVRTGTNQEKILRSWVFMRITGSDYFQSYRQMQKDKNLMPV